MDAEESQWALDELCAQIALALADDAAGPSDDGRIRGVPDARTVRYYTTLGLLDRPAAYRGRTALYGRRHLLQLLAIKRLQKRGETLQQIQQRLLGLPGPELERLAGLPLDGESPPRPAAPAGFWKTPPAPAGPAPGGDVAQTVRLADDVLLTLPYVRPIDADDVQLLRAAAAPLLHLLTQRRLRRPRPE